MPCQGQGLAGKQLRLERGIVTCLELPVRLADASVVTALQVNLTLLTTLRPQIPKHWPADVTRSPLLEDDSKVAHPLPPPLLAPWPITGQVTTSPGQGCAGAARGRRG